MILTVIRGNVMNEQPIPESTLDAIGAALGEPTLEDVYTMCRAAMHRAEVAEAKAAELQADWIEKNDVQRNETLKPPNTHCHSDESVENKTTNEEPHLSLLPPEPKG